jgi:hypothetical protein
MKICRALHKCMKQYDISDLEPLRTDFQARDKFLDSIKKVSLRKKAYRYFDLPTEAQPEEDNEDTIEKPEQILIDTEITSSVSVLLDQYQLEYWQLNEVNGIIIDSEDTIEYVHCNMRRLLLSKDSHISRLKRLKDLLILKGATKLEIGKASCMKLVATHDLTKSEKRRKTHFHARFSDQTSNIPECLGLHKEITTESTNYNPTTALLRSPISSNVITADNTNEAYCNASSSASLCSTTEDSQSLVQAHVHTHQLQVKTLTHLYRQMIGFAYTATAAAIMLTTLSFGGGHSESNYQPSNRDEDSNTIEMIKTVSTKAASVLNISDNSCDSDSSDTHSLAPAGDPTDSAVDIQNLGTNKVLHCETETTSGVHNSSASSAHTSTSGDDMQGKSDGTENMFSTVATLPINDFALTPIPGIANQTPSAAVAMKNKMWESRKKQIANTSASVDNLLQVETIPLSYSPSNINNEAAKSTQHDNRMNRSCSAVSFSDRNLGNRSDSRVEDQEVLMKKPSATAANLPPLTVKELVEQFELLSITSAPLTPLEHEPSAIQTPPRFAPQTPPADQRLLTSFVLQQIQELESNSISRETEEPVVRAGKYASVRGLSTISMTTASTNPAINTNSPPKSNMQDSKAVKSHEYYSANDLPHSPTENSLIWVVSRAPAKISAMEFPIEKNSQAEAQADESVESFASQKLCASEYMDNKDTRERPTSKYFDTAAVPLLIRDDAVQFETENMERPPPSGLLCSMDGAYRNTSIGNCDSVGGVGHSRTSRNSGPVGLLACLAQSEKYAGMARRTPRLGDRRNIIKEPYGTPHTLQRWHDSVADSSHPSRAEEHRAQQETRQQAAKSASGTKQETPIAKSAEATNSYLWAPDCNEIDALITSVLEDYRTHQEQTQSFEKAGDRYFAQENLLRLARQRNFVRSTVSPPSSTNKNPLREREHIPVQNLRENLYSRKRHRSVLPDILPSIVVPAINNRATKAEENRQKRPHYESPTASFLAKCHPRVYY